MKEITVTLKEKVDFSKAKIGDDVFCIRKGAGKIVQIAKGTYYSVHVLFNTGEENSYLFTGRDIMPDIYIYMRRSISSTQIRRRFFMNVQRQRLTGMLIKGS